ncbi:MAG: hypothetical protein CMH52_01560 [Myxococcales bacterium]|nr:hypothetical protein [Myxococcales bacterium]
MTRVAVIGGGHNALVAAAYLAKSGFDVDLLDKADTPGGLARSRPIAEGHESLGTLSDTARFRGWVEDELELSKVGLQRVAKTHRLTLHKPEAPPIYVHGNTADGSSAESHKRSYQAFIEFLTRISPTLRTVIDQTPLDPLGPVMPLLGPLLKVRRLGAKDMTEVMRISSMCIADWLRDSLEDERLGAGLCLDGLDGTWAGPWSPWTALNYLLKWTTQGTPIVGGAPALAKALIERAEQLGARLHLQRTVTKIVVENNVVRGVEFENGQMHQADIVLSALDPKMTFLNLVSRGATPPSLIRRVDNIRMRGTTAILDVALSGRPVDHVGTSIERLRNAHSFDQIEQAFDCSKYGRASAHPIIDILVMDASGGAICPDGHSIASVTVRYARMLSNDGLSEQDRAEFKSCIYSAIESACPGFRKMVIADRLQTPDDLHRDYGLSGGHLDQGEMAPDQLLFMRPTIELSKYKTPISGLYLCSNGSHPGGGLTGVAGALAAKNIIKNP